jgi:hypothetical protein
MNLLKAASTVSVFTLLSRITGLVREQLMAATFGASALTDAFNVAFRIPNLLRRLFAEGAFSQAFVPLLAATRTRDGDEATRHLVDAVGTVLTWALLATCVVGIVGAPVIVWAMASGLVAFDQAVFMTRLMFPYIACMSLVALAAGVLNTWRRFAVPAATPVLLNLAWIAAILFLSPAFERLGIEPIYGLAVGVLVDDATVGIENIHRVQEHEPDIEQAILQGAGQIAVPTLVSTLAICIVFVPIFFLSGAAGALFRPLAMAVVFAMMASYVISRTLVPTLVKFAMERERALESKRAGLPHTTGAFAQLHYRFEHLFERMRVRYRLALTSTLSAPATLVAMALVVLVSGAALAPWLGRDFFPQVDAGQIRLHLRAPVGTRIEETARLVAAAAPAPAYPVWGLSAVRLAA